MIELNLSTGQVDEGDTKVLSVTPKDGGGNAVTPSALAAVFTPPSGDAVTKDIDDFSQSSGTYSLPFTFDTPGTWTITVTATDSQSRTEVETGRVYVHPT